MDLEAEDIIENKGNKDVGHQAYCNYQEIFQFTAYSQDEKQQKYD